MIKTVLAVLSLLVSTTVKPAFGVMKYDVFSIHSNIIQSWIQYPLKLNKDWAISPIHPAFQSNEVRHCPIEIDTLKIMFTDTILSESGVRPPGRFCRMFPAEQVWLERNQSVRLGGGGNYTCR